MKGWTGLSTGMSGWLLLAIAVLGLTIAWAIRWAYLFVHHFSLKRMGDLRAAELVYVTTAGVTKDAAYPVLKLTLELSADGKVYRRTFTKTCDGGNPPRQGQQLGVYVNTRNPADFTLQSATMIRADDV